MNRPDADSAEGRLAAARIDELHARGRWYRTLNEVQLHTSVEGVTARVLGEVRATSGELATRAVNAAKARPIAMTLIAAGALAFFFRRPIARGLGRLIPRRRATRATDR